jgi:hypothetical protein
MRGKHVLHKYDLHFALLNFTEQKFIFKITLNNSAYQEKSKIRESFNLLCTKRSSKFLNCIIHKVIISANERQIK